MISECDVLNALRSIMDPDLGRDIVSLGFVKDLVIHGGDIRFTLELTTPACPMRRKFVEMCEQALKPLPGVQTVEVKLSARESHGHAHGHEAPDTLSEIGAIVAVSSCKGGVGKSTVAAQLACAMRREGLAVGLFDADVFGPSAPTLFHLYNPPVVIQENRITPVDAAGLKLMSLGFLLGDAPAVLRGPLVSSYIQQALLQTDWGKLDYLIIDLPPGTGDIQLTIVQMVNLDGAVIVTTPQALSLVDVARGILMFEKVNVPVLGVVENLASFKCPDCGAMHYPFGDGARSLRERFGLPSLGVLPIDPSLAELSMGPSGPEAFASLAQAVHRAIGMSRAEAIRPPEVSLKDGSITVRWQDGHEAQFEPRALRYACPCAACVDEHTGVRTLKQEDVAAEITAGSYQRLGHYAVSFAWSDGHSTGIYSWEYLRELSEGGKPKGI